MNRHSNCTQTSGIRGNVWSGLLLMIIGGVLLMRQFGFNFPQWLFSWPMIPIIVGLFIGVKNNFRDMGWLPPVALGSIFLLDKIYPELPIQQFAWPLLIIGVGLIILFSPKRNRRSPGPTEANNFRREETPVETPEYSERPGQTYNHSTSLFTEEKLDIAAVFGGIKKRILSKNFKGGEIVAVFGGCEINLTQADFPELIEIEVVQIFGGTKLIVPANWEVRSEAFVMLGGIDDKRSEPSPGSASKILVLKGTTICGGIEIISH